MFGEVWCAQEADGVTEACVVCDAGMDGGGEEALVLAGRVRAAFGGSEGWTDGAGEREVEEEERVEEVWRVVRTHLRLGQRRT